METQGARGHRGLGAKGKQSVKDIDKERLDIAYAMTDRLYRGLKTTKVLRGKELKRMKLVEEAIQRLEVARAL